MFQGIFIRRLNCLSVSVRFWLVFTLITGLLGGSVLSPAQAEIDDKGREFFGLDSSEVAENQEIGTTVGSFTSMGLVAPTYSLPDDEDTDNHLFAIEGQELRTAAVFDFETRNVYTVLVIASSDGEEGLGKIFTIDITDINEEPVISEGDVASVSMDENGSPTGFSLTLNADDPDGDTLTWTITSQAENGTASVSGTGNSKAVSYSPTPGYSGSERFVVQEQSAIHQPLATAVLSVLWFRWRTATAAQMPLRCMLISALRMIRL